MPDIFISNNSTPSDSVTPTNTSTEKIAITPAPTTQASPVGNKIHLLTSFCLNPIEVNLKDLDVNDQLILFLRRDLVTNVPWLIEGIIAFLIPPLIGVLVGALNFPISFPPNFVFFALLSYYLLVFQFFFLNFLNWFFNISIVTKLRIIDIDFRILLSKNVASTKIAQVEDVSLNQIGIIRAIFDYGDVLVQTAGTEDNFDFQAVPSPEKVVHIVSDLIGSEQHV